MNNNIGIFICIVGLIALPFVVYYFGWVSGLKLFVTIGSDVFFYKLFNKR